MLTPVSFKSVRLAKQGPPVVARSLAIAHTCIYDAWASYNDKAPGAVTGETMRRPAAERNAANRKEAISYAAYACLRNLFPSGESRLRAAFATMGYNPDNQSIDPSTPAGLGNSVALVVIASRRHDGSNQYGDLAPGAYKDYTGYVPQNSPQSFCTPQWLACAPLVVNDEYKWQPLYNDMGTLQAFVVPHWERVKPLALTSADQLDKLPGLKPLPSIQRDNHSIGKDAKMFFAMHNASFDAGIVAWHLKRKFEGVRPITAVRFYKQGQSMSFSSASATVLQLITGSDKFNYQTTIPANFGRVEPGVPAVPTVIAYKKFSDAVADAAMSRLYGGIHFKDDDTAGQVIGAAAGQLAYDKAQKLFNGSFDD